MMICRTPHRNDMPKILILYSDPDIPRMLRHSFPATDFVLEAQADTALRRISAERPNVAIIGHNLAGKSGLDVLREAKKIDPGLAVIMVTEKANQDREAIESMKLGAFDCLTKPISSRMLQSVVTKALEGNLLSRKIRDIPPASIDSDKMIGVSPKMVEIWKKIGQISNAEATVLIQGESGTGKELLARAIYRNSNRRHRSFLTVNCAALPETLLESELFGHEKGAFTDAYCRRIGKFEQCNGGTIFLDEIGEMSLANQAKLLRVLENQEFERVGGNETIKVDVRVITATNISMVKAVKEKTFRMDLYYRLRVISFCLPPLRERPEDIPILVDAFVGMFSQKYGKKIKGIESAAMDMLAAHWWEGNIRELKNAVESATVLCRGNVLSCHDFGFNQEQVINPDSPAYVDSGFFQELLKPHFDRLCNRYRGDLYWSINKDLDKALVAFAMENTGNEVQGAKMLGISRNKFRDIRGSCKT